MKHEFGGVTLVLLKGDITRQNTNAIVNAANSNLAHGGGVAWAIASKAGPELERESREAPFVPTGEVHTTTAGNLSSNYVIHAVGPIWNGGGKNEAQLLRSCVENSLKEAERLNCNSISIPAISTGIFGYPIEMAAKVILKSIIDFLNNMECGLRLVQVVLFSENDYRTFEEILEALIGYKKEN